ncbi:GNAT family N-acetyltransferase [Pseudophaeobacter leonis]|uniref:GNAT family N-acetyltransferase n=1 Tax=Pseudophaeobacter leonis TaxID=1144477 RepID=UPI0009F5E7FF|nr:GNAT family N-acetyltransferase [Pseudophaeobacter leonis]
MENEITIRDASQADFAQWRTLWDQYNAFYGRVGATALSEEIVLTTWHRFLDPAEPVQCLLAENQEQLVGLAHFISHRNTITVENTCYLRDLFSRPSLRGKGIGRRLIAEFYDRAKQAGTIGVYWHTHSSNETAMRLYDRVATNTEFVVYRETLSKTPI